MENNIWSECGYMQRSPTYDYEGYLQATIYITGIHMLKKGGEFCIILNSKRISEWQSV